MFRIISLITLLQLNFGVIADPQYSRESTIKNNRYYSASAAKLREAVRTFNSTGMDFVVSLGDNIDRDIADYDSLKVILDELECPFYNVLGNHDFAGEKTAHTFRNALKVLGVPSPGYYVRHLDGIDLIFLDTNAISTYANVPGSKSYLEAEATIRRLKDEGAENSFSWNGAAGRKQTEWLDKQLSRSEKRGRRAIIFGHSPMTPEGGMHSLWDSRIVVDVILSHKDAVIAYLCGHNHKGGMDYVEGIPFITFEGMVETTQNRYATVKIDGGLTVEGYGTQPSYICPTPGTGYGPWICNMSGNGFTVLWTTPVPSMGWVELSDGEQTARFVRRVSGRMETSIFHSVDVTGLEPGREYTYKIRGKSLLNFNNPYVGTYTGEYDFTEPRKVSTFDSRKKNCAFSMMNDMHFQADRYHTLASQIDTDEEDFLLLAGDIVSFANDIDSVMQYAIQPALDVVSSIPAVFCRGNHETKGADTRLLPEVFPSPTGELYFSFRQGPVAFIVLDNGGKTPDSDPGYSGDAAYDEYRAEELEWLKRTVREPFFTDAQYRVALIHMPFHGDEKGSYTQKEMSRRFMPVLNDAGIDLMLCGHQHIHNYVAPGKLSSTLPDGSTATNRFPMITNSNTERLRFHADANGITIDTYTVTDSLSHHYEIH